MFFEDYYPRAPDLFAEVMTNLNGAVAWDGWPGGEHGAGRRSGRGAVRAADGLGVHGAGGAPEREVRGGRRMDPIAWMIIVMDE